MRCAGRSRTFSLHKKISTQFACRSFSTVPGRIINGILHLAGLAVLFCFMILDALSVRHAGWNDSAGLLPDDVFVVPAINQRFHLSIAAKAKQDPAFHAFAEE